MNGGGGGGNCLISGIKLSSVVPAKATGENKVQELTAIDLAMKLHYIRGVYLFRASEEVRNLTIYDMKKPMFPLLELYYVVAGRIRRRIEDGDRPFIKCNDGGVRIVEADCEKTVDDWLNSIEDHEISRRDCGFVHSHAIGPDLGFSPLVFMQLTRFKCGGLSVGLSWAHVIGDIFSASTFINAWGHIMNNRPLDQLRPPYAAEALLRPTDSIGRSTSPVKRLDSTGDLWIGSSDCKMATRSFRITEEQLDRISSVVGRNRAANFSNFEAIAAIFWKSLSKIRLVDSDSDSKTISIYSTKCPNREGEFPRNGMVMSAVEADVAVAGAEEGALAEMIVKKKIDEGGEIEELVEKEREDSDFIAYGARLTFVDLEEANLYGLELEGQKPVHVNYEIGGVGENGVVLVLPGPPRSDGRDGGGRTVTVILPEKQLPDLIDELQKQWTIV